MTNPPEPKRSSAQSQRRSLLCAAVLLLCGPSIHWGQTPTPTTPPEPAAALFDGTFVHELRLTLKPADWSKLKAEYLQNTVFEAKLQWQGNPAEQVAPMAFSSIGVRSRGSNSRDPRKPSLRLDLNKYEKKQNLFGLTTLVLDNAVQDASYLAERLAQSFYARMGIPAPRATHTRLFVNGEYLGLYVLLERIDEAFLMRTMKTSAGDLYEFNRPAKTYRLEFLGDDKALYSPDMFEPKNEKQDIAALVDWIKAINQPVDANYLDNLSKHMDIKAFARYLALEIYMADYDGLTGIVGANNFYLYRRPSDGRFLFLPWDKDFSFGAPDFPINFGFQGHALAERLWSLPEFQELYRKELEAAIEADSGWLRSQAEKIAAMIHSDIEADPYWRCEGSSTLTCSAAKAEEQTNYVLEVIQSRPIFVAEAAAGMTQP